MGVGGMIVEGMVVWGDGSVVGHDNGGSTLTRGGGVRPADPNAPNALPKETLEPAPLLTGLESSPPSTLTLKASDTRLRI